MSGRADPICISWLDAFLRRSDVQTLDHGEWVGDNVLAFHAEWLSATSLTARRGQPQIRMWSPSLVELLCSLPDAENASQVIPYPHESFILLPVSDHYARVNRGASIGGSHWSLLLVDVAQRRSIHLDSLRDMNLRAAQSVSQAIWSLLDLNHPMAHRRKVHFELFLGLGRQQNGSDCGVYALYLSHSLQRLLESNLSNLDLDSSPNLLDQVVQEAAARCTPSQIAHFRMSYRTWLVKWAKAAEAQQNTSLWRTVQDVRSAIGDYETGMK